MKSRDFKNVKKLAEGGFAELYTARNPKGQTVVFRQLRKEFKFNRKRKSVFLTGIDIRRKCGDHPNIAKYLGHSTGSMFELPFEIIEHVPGYTLKGMIFNKNKTVMSNKIDVLRQCACGLLQVHQSGYLHLDVKPENFLVNDAGGELAIKLTDFDLSLPITKKKEGNNHGGSLLYLPPEFVSRNEVTVATDIYAFGIIAYQLYTLRMPFDEYDVKKSASIRPLLFFTEHEKDTLEKGVMEFISKCLNFVPENRYRNGGELFVALENLKRKARS